MQDVSGILTAHEISHDCEGSQGKTRLLQSNKTEILPAYDCQLCMRKSQIFLRAPDKILMRYQAPEYFRQRYSAPQWVWC